MRIPSPRWRRRLRWIVPVALLLTLAAPYAWAAASDVFTQLGVLGRILLIARDVYVDPVDSGKLLDGAIDGLLDRLDPHSSYLPPDEAQRLGERLRGHFGGVGIQYSIIDNVPTVVSTIEGGPAARAGLLTGDRIIMVDGVTTAGWRESEVQEHLRGPVGTHVKVALARAGTTEPMEVEIVRGEIPLKSVPYAFMLDDSTGYLRITNFAQTTGREVGDALARLRGEGMRVLLIDLRDNGGGDLDAAVDVCNFFLPAGTTIVSQRGRWAEANAVYTATAASPKYDLPVVVMINHGSASASEIVAGAIQDTDRGVIVGQRSFGKGLVQRSFDMSREVRGGGVLLLTVARYYTPTGRLIQRDYRTGTNQYILEGLSDDSPADTARGEMFTTPLGRVVYGGGGIRPDQVVPRNRYNPIVVRLANRSAFFRFADDLVNRGRTFAPDYQSFRQFAVDDALYEEFVGFARRLDAEIPEDSLRVARRDVEPYITSDIAGRLWGPESRYRMLAPSDPELAAARRSVAAAAHLRSAAAMRSR